jgi:hypothetical protein
MPRPRLAAPDVRADDNLSKRNMPRANQISWRDCPLLPLDTASVVGGPSVASLYRFEAQGKLQFKRLAGRTFVVTRSLIELIDSAEDWSASDRGKAARQKRAETARANWRRS